jgi:ferredoxin
MVNLRILLAVLPMIGQPLPATGQILSDIPVQQNIYSNAAAAIEACSSCAATVSAGEQPRPEQGGERITEDYLLSLSEGDCLWRFK